MYYLIYRRFLHTVSIAGYIKKQFGMAPLVTNITDYSGNITDYSGNITDYSGNITDYSGNITDYSGNICTQLCVQFVLQPLLFMLSSCLFTGSCSDRKWGGGGRKQHCCQVSWCGQLHNYSVENYIIIIVFQSKKRKWSLRVVSVIATNTHWLLEL